MHAVKKIIRICFLLFCIFLVSFLFSTCMTPSILVTREQNQGDVLFNQHKYSEAISHYRMMLVASRKLGIYRNLSMESEVSRKIANGYEMSGGYEDAMINVHQAMVLDSLDNNLLNRIEDYRHEGKIYIYMGSFFNGITSLEKSLALSEGMDQKSEEYPPFDNCRYLSGTRAVIYSTGKIRKCNEFYPESPGYFQTGRRLQRRDGILSFTRDYLY